jgi:hypothetical protein
MARSEIVALTLAETVQADPAATTIDTVNGHYVQLGGLGVMLRIQNLDSGAAHTITLRDPTTVSGLALADRALSIAQSTTQVVKLGPTSLWAQPGTNQLNLDGDSTQLRVQAYRLA